MIKLIIEEKPRGKFIALFADGSGCTLFRTKEDGSYLEPPLNEEDSVDIDWLLDTNYLHWIQLPDDYEMWGEV